MQLDAVTVLGMGNMGCALIRALTKGGHRVTAWNRSDRSQQAAKLGIALAKNTVTAIVASEVIIACLSSYEATHQVLESEEARRALEGKTLIQLSTGLPEQAMALAQWAAENRVPYLDGKIAVVPESIGLESAVIFWAGKKTVFRRHVATLRSLAGNPVYVGADVQHPRATSPSCAIFFYPPSESFMGLRFGRQAGWIRSNTFL
ncbi:NAD(P)-dependent oxidoreductase [Mesorhizobium sp. M2E.F.Ca.ET.209.01.1.1]|uniref:NAD(P)-binding domain-containing protein n=1 Tax=Mesorhizobium sp. M2E.F.Ca.ET.209.01.1.1 TaxID=2500526 RepID=UPI000FDB23E0|nr:NAD(P)-binding domain-containing protein [Mesorhizobium sp. M2E.F.Ca.ET.209.01.1.1]TGS14249.1 NAD(P)-dependent oxidoreductase [Mesorhizobium sp. M2E.F.Ca.ET.209.01.1.1]